MNNLAGQNLCADYFIKLIKPNSEQTIVKLAIVKESNALFDNIFENIQGVSYNRITDFFRNF